MMVILSVVIAWDSIPTVYYSPVYRFWWILTIFRFTTSQCTVERQQGSSCATIYYIEYQWTQNPTACKTYPMGVEIFPLIFLICWTYEQAIYDIRFKLKYVYILSGVKVLTDSYLSIIPLGYIIPTDTKSQACKTYPMGVKIFQLIFQICYRHINKQYITSDSIFS